MMKKILFLLIITTFGRVFSQDFTLNGNVLTPFEGYLYLIYGGKIDSVKVENQQFSFSGKINQVQKANLLANKMHSQTGFFILEPTEISVDIAIENKKSVYFKNLRGGKSVTNVKNFLLFKQKNKNASNLSQLLHKKLKEMLRAEPKNQMYGILFADMLSQRALNYDQASDLLKNIDASAQASDEMARINEIMQTLEKTQIGAKFPAFELPNVKEELVSVEKTSHRKKFTLISFNATDCIPCVELDRKLLAVYEEFKGKGFTIYEVFLEQDRGIWEAHLAKEKIPWTSVLAMRKFSNPAVKSIGITNVPANFLLDNSGKIVAVNIGATLLKKKLSETLK